MSTSETLKPLSLRISEGQMELLKHQSVTNHRTISGQAAFMLNISQILQSEYPDVFNQILIKLNEVKDET